MDIDFNNQKILQGHLEQVLPQLELDKVKERIVIGGKGGLVYDLFPSGSRERTSFKVYSLEDLAREKAYLNALESYVGDAGNYAESKDFKLVFVEDGLVHYYEDIGSADIYYAGIGDNYIKDAERVENFLNMVKEGHVDLDKKYQKLQGLADVCRTQ